jgi:hypothetical protein
VVYAIALAVSVPISVLAVVWATLVASITCYGVNAGYAQRVIDYSIGRQINDLLKPIVGTIAMALVIGALTFASPLNPPALLFASVTTGIAVYVAVSFVLRIDAVTKTSFELIGTLTGWSPSPSAT